MEKKKYLQFEEHSGEYSKIISWWQGLREAKGERAELRRCREVEEIFFVPVFHSIKRKLLPYGHVSDGRLAITVALLSHVKNNLEGISLPEQMARPGAESSRPRVSDLRFRRLIQIKNIDDLLLPMLRIIKMLDSTVNVPNLVKSIYGWNDYVRKQWAFDYYKDSKD
ncbi:MAG: type I-E CRISPR-associated protein Cse2/CasB [Planctomycetes bacterium]|nr:type I-E CRISPR-associated protein Cse2/CasB [Planctomycetota bacterium]